MKILCLISHGLYEPWLRIYEDGQKETWLKDEQPAGFQVAHFHGTPVSALGRVFDKVHERIRWSNRFGATSLKIFDSALSFPFRNLLPNVTTSELLKARDPVLHVHQPDMYCTYKWKEVGVFSYVLANFNFDYVFTTTTSSYIRPRKLMEVLENQPRDGFYAGMIPYVGANFASGSNRIFSRDLIEIIVAERKSINSAVIEDVSIADLLRKHNVAPIPLSGLNLSEASDIDTLTTDEIESNYHFRLKSGTLANRMDVELFHQLHDRVKNVS